MLDNPRAALAARLTESDWTTEAAGTAAHAAKLSADPTGEEIDAEVQRILATAQASDFAEGSAGHRAAFLRQYKADLVKEREAEGPRTPLLDARLARGAGSAAAELDARLGRIPS